MSTDFPWIVIKPEPSSSAVILELSALPENLRKLEISLSVSALSELPEDRLAVLPYSEYSEDLVENKRSLYQVETANRDQAFGLVLGAAIITIVSAIDIRLLWSVESLVSCFAAYTVGKEIWQDLEKWLVRSTQTGRWRWREVAFAYSRQHFGTLQRFWQLARTQRYGFDVTLASRFDYIHHHRSQTVELEFSAADLRHSTQRRVRLGSLSVGQPDIEKVLISLHCATYHHALVGRTKQEYFQSVLKGKLGTVDDTGQWLADTATVRTGLQLGPIEQHKDGQSVQKKILTVSK